MDKEETESSLGAHFIHPTHFCPKVSPFHAIVGI